MDKKIAGLLGAVAGLATMSTAQAAISPSTPAAGSQASSYADLLAPIANPITQLQADNAMRAQEAAVEPLPELQLAQAYYTAYPYANNHHHHHHHTYSRHYTRNNHHHHHHHQRTVIGIPGVGGVVVR